MKKFLSLALALVMTMSLVVVGAGAKEFTDDSKIQYDEAVAVISACKIIDGYTDGSFNPAGTLTRGAAAKIICNMILGPTTAAALSADTAPFKDVPANHVFAGYIAYCAQQGIINGYADGSFKPAGTVTGYQFMKMLLGALGYEGKYEGFTGANWSVNVAKLALNLGLDDGNDEFVGTKAMTREEACLYAFNTLKADMVEYDSNTQITVGDVVITTASKAKKVEDEKDKYGTIAKDGILQFAEKYFSKLTSTPAADDDEDFGRPGIVWDYDGDEIGVFADEADYVVVLDENYKAADFKDNADISEELEDLTGHKDLEVNNKTELYLNGDKTTTAGAVAAAGKGTTLELYMKDDVVTRIVAYYYTLDQITDVDTDVSAKDAKDDITAYVTFDKAGEYDDVDVEGYDAKTYTEDTYVAYVMNKAGEIIASYLPEIETGKVTSKGSDYVKVDGTKYTKTWNADTLPSIDYDSEYTLIVDENGYLMGIDGVKGDTIKNLYYITKVYKDNDKKTGDSYFAEAITMAGVVDDLEITEDSFKALDGKAGLYTLKLNKDDIYVATAFTNADEDYDVYTEASFDTDVKKTATKMTVGNKKVYLDEATSFMSIKLRTTGYAKEVSVADGGMSYAGSNKATAIVITEEKKNEALYVLYVGANMSSVVSTDDVVFVTDVSTEDNEDGFLTDIVFMTDNKEDTVTVKTDVAKAVGFFTYSVDDDGIYELKATDYISDAKVDDDTEGWDEISFADDDIYNNAVTASGYKATFDDVAFASAKVIDLRDDISKDKVYDREITSISGLKSAAKSGTVTAFVYVIDGNITFIAVEAVR